MSAELPHLGTIWEVPLNRRNFFRLLGAAAGTLALDCLPQSLGQGPSSKENLLQEEYFPPRTKLSEIVRWREEGPSHLKEIEAGAYLLGLSAWSAGERKVFVSDLQTGTPSEFQLPAQLAWGNLEFSPDGRRLAVYGSGALSVLELTEKKARQIYQGGSLKDPGISWSPDGEFLMLSASLLEIAGRQVAPRPPAGQPPLAWTPVPREKKPRMLVFHPPTGRVLYQEEERIGGAGFSPDGQWVVTRGSNDGSNFDLKALNLRTGENRFLFDGFASEGAWCSLGERTFVAFVDPNRGSLQELRMFDLATGQQRGLGDGSHLFRILPDGKSILFLKGQQKIGVLDLKSAENRFFSLGGDIRVGDLGHSTFSSDGREFIFLNWNLQSEWFEIYVLNLVTGQLALRQKLIRENGMRVEKFLTPEWLVLSTSVSDTSRWELFSLASGRKFPLGQTRQAFPFKLSASLFTEGDVLQSGENAYLFSQGRKYPLALEGADFLATTPKPIPARTAEQIPESVNKLAFSGGDLVLVQGGGGWYLRDDQRYPVVDLGSFQNNVQFNRQRYEVPQVIFKRIPEGQDPLEGKPGFPDWDGHFVEAHREGSILLLFVKGWKSASDDGPSFPELKRGLRENNCSTDGRMAEFTYKTKRKPNGELELLPYDSTHAAVVPITPTKYLEWQLERYKKLLPWTKIILIAHSLGGWLAFNAALNQAEAVRAVITLDSPLKGINKTLIGDRGEAILRGLWGDEVVNFLIRMGDEVPEEAIERRAKMLQERGVEVFTFASTDDLLVPHQVAFLENRTQNLDGFSLNLRFTMGRLAGLDAPWINPFFTGDPREELKEWLNTVVTAHGTVTRHPEVIKTIAKVVGKISS